MALIEFNDFSFSYLNSDGTKLNAPSFAIPCTGRASYQDSSRKAATCCQAIPDCMKWGRHAHCELNRALGSLTNLWALGVK